MLISTEITEIPISQLLPLSASIFFLFYFSYNYFLHPLSKVPGPLICRLGLPSWLYYRVYHRDVVFGLLSAHKDYGKNGILAPILRIGKNTISVADPDLSNQVYSPSLRLPKTRFYEGLNTDQRPPGPSILFQETNNKFHTMLKKQSAHSYSAGAVSDCAEFVTPQIELLISKLSESSKDGKSVDLSHWLYLFAFDAVTDLAFGKSFDCLIKGNDGGAGEMTEKFFNDGVLQGCQNWLIPFFRLKDRIPGNTPATFKFFDLVRPIVESRLKSLERGEIPRPDLLTKFIESRDETMSAELSMYRIMTNAAGVVVGGSDTTSNFLRSFFMLVLSNPRIYKKLMEEIDQAVDEGSLSSPASQSQGTSLQYFQLCILEVQRFAPIVGLPLLREAPSGGMRLGDHFIPAKTSIGSSAWLVHRNKELYGQDSEFFRPERWEEEADKEKRKKMERCLQFFGVGTRICVGRFIATMEYQRVIPTLLINFHFSIVPRGPGSPHKKEGTNVFTGKVDSSSPANIASWWFNEYTDLYVNIKDRKKD